MSLIAKIEDQIIAECRAALTVNGRLLVRDIDTIPGALSAAILQRLIQRAPGCYVAFIDGQSDNVNSASFSPRFDVIAVTGHKGGEQPRRRGDQTQIGAYQILEYIIPGVHNCRVADVGALYFRGIHNLFSEATFDLGATVYYARFQVPSVRLEPALGAGRAADEAFITFSAEHDIDSDKRAEQRTEVTLEQK